MLLEERADEDVASQLCISPATLKKHVGNIYKKVGANNRAQLLITLSKRDQ